MLRVKRVVDHLSPHSASSEPILPPVVVATPEFTSNPTAFLLAAKRLHPDMFLLRKSPREQYVVISDPSMFEDVLSDEHTFGNPITPNMSVNKLVFEIPPDELEQHENNAVKQLRRLLIHHDDQLASAIADKLQSYMETHLGESGDCDLRDLGTAVFWPMTEALFGAQATRDKCPHLLEAFEHIDSNFGAALRGKHIPQVKQAVKEANQVFSSAAPGCPLAPIPQFYKDLTGGDPELTAKFCTSAWWGGQGNTLPATVWTFGLLLSDPKWKQMAYDEVDQFSGVPDSQGIYDFKSLQFLTACLKEALRLKTYSIAWRSVQTDVTLSSNSGNKYLIKKGQLLSVVWSMQHMDPCNFKNPHQFNPTRWIGTHENADKPLSWAPFSHGIHKCSGFPLALMEIPVVLALFLKRYDMEVLDHLPGMDFQSAFGVVGPDDTPVRIRYRKR